MKTKFRNRLGIAGALIVLATLCACKTESTEKVITLKDCKRKTDSISVTPVKTDLMLLNPSKINVCGDYLVVSQAKTEKVFSIFHLPLDGKGFEAGHVGRGPNEFIRPDLQSITVHGSGFSIVDMDSYAKEIRIEGDSIRIADKQLLYTNGEAPNGVIKVGDSFINTNLFVDKNPKEFVVYKKDGSRNYICDFPTWGNEAESPIMKALDYMRAVVAHPSKDMFAAFYCHYRKFRIHSLDGTLLKEVSVEFPDSPIKNVKDNGVNRFDTYTSTPCASEDRIAVLCKNRYHADKDLGDTRELQVWDWNGNLVHRTIIKAPLSLVTIDFDKGILYGIGPDENDESCIYTADVSKFI